MPRSFEGSDPSRLRAAAQTLKSSLVFFLLFQVHQVASLQGSRIIEGVRCRAGPRTTPVVIFVTVSTCSFASEAPESASARGPHTFESISRPRGPAWECSTATQHCSEDQGTRGPFHPVDELLTDCARIVPRASISRVTTAPSPCRKAKAQACPVTSTTSVNMSWTVAETPPTQELPYMSPDPTCVANSYSLLFTELPAFKAHASSRVSVVEKGRRISTEWICCKKGTNTLVWRSDRSTTS